VNFSKHRRTLLIIGTAIAVLTGLAALIIYQKFGDQITFADLETLRSYVYTFLGTIPPLGYFLALVILPAAGVPLTLFYLTALPVLGSQSTLLGLLLVWMALAMNMALAHFLSRGLFYPLISWAIRHRGLSIPKIQPVNEWQLVLAVRLSPIPFALQNYLLALGHARWRTYLFASLPIQAGIGTAVMLLGESILSGGLGFVLVALSALLVMQLVAKKLRARITEPQANDPSQDS
jgi:uncharacterized membrane protein YdjX (TVP38/TMEM64 family)